MAIFAIKCFGTQENDFRKWEKLMSRISVFNRTKLKKNKNNLMKLSWMENGSPFYFLIQLVCDCLSIISILLTNPSTKRTIPTWLKTNWHIGTSLGI